MGVETHRPNHEWGPSPMNHAPPGAPQASAMQSSRVARPCPVLCGGHKPKACVGSTLDDGPGSCLPPTHLETRQPNPAHTARARRNGTTMAHGDFHRNAPELKRHKTLLHQRKQAQVFGRKQSHPDIVSAADRPQKLSEIDYTHQDVNRKSLTFRPNPASLTFGLEQLLVNSSAL